MIWLLVLCFPALAIAQFGLPPDRPLHELCGHSTQGAGRQQFAALDAESLHTYDQLRLELDLRVEHADNAARVPHAMRMTANCAWPLRLTNWPC